MAKAAVRQDGLPESAIKRLKAATVLGIIRGEEWESEAGIMKLRGEISEADYDIIRKYNALRRAYCKAIGIKEAPPSPSFEVRSSAAPPDPDSERGQKITADEQRAMSAFTAWTDAGQRCGSKAWNRFELIVGYNRRHDFEDAALVKQVCAALRVQQTGRRRK